MFQTIPQKAYYSMQPSVYDYIDYRQYLTDLFISFKKDDRRFSYRRFARMAGSSSPNFLQLIKARILNIRPQGISALAASLQLSENEQRYFTTIVAFDHAKTHEIKDSLFQQILTTRQYTEIKQLQKSQYDYFSHWYIPVIRELVTHPQYPGIPEWIAQRIIPQISESKVRKGIELLESLGLIQIDIATKRWKQTENVISTPSEVMSVALIRYHQDAIGLGREAIHRFGPDKRDVRAVTIGVSKEGYTEIKKRLESFWKELLAFSSTQEDSSQVVQVNMQMFPLTTDIQMEQSE